MTVSAHRATVEPFRVKYHSPELRCDVRAVRGYQARCQCEARFPIRGTRQEAVYDKAAHLLACRLKAADG